MTAARRRGWSDITVTDQFCGAGGSSIGATKAGLRVRMAMNHWKLAVQTHNTNFPDTDHDTCDISAADPRRYPSTDILITSPECTTHSPAGGNRRSKPQRDFFHSNADDPSVARSRATMWDVLRFAEFHEYRRIIVENVVEAYTKWPLFGDWLRAMHTLGYRHRIVSLNSMFCWPTPQSRDRIYINFWKKGDKAPDLDIRPKAPCLKCGRVVEAEQSWKPGALMRAAGAQPVGKFRFQYVYTCAECRTEVTPFYFAALNAIDFSIPATRIGDRAAGRELKPRTLERIQYGLEKYGRRQLLIRTVHGERLFCRVRDAEAMPFATQPGSQITGLFSPYLVDCAHAYDNHSGLRSVDDPHASQSARQETGIAQPFIIEAGNASHRTRRVRGLDEEFSTVHAGGGNHAVVGPLPFLAALRGTDDSQRSSWAIGGDEPIGTVSAGGIHHALIGPGFAPFITMRRGGDHAQGFDGVVPTVTATGEAQHLVVQGAAQISMRDSSGMRVAGLDAEMRAQGCAPQQALIQNSPFLTTVAFQQQARGSQARGIDDPMANVVGNDRDALVQPGAELRVEDCYFRMLQPHEIGAAMAFPTEYTVLGNKRDRVKQYGNAVTPPAMETLIQRNVQAMTGARAE